MSITFSGVTISTLGWIVVGVVAWLVIAAVLGVLIGRMIRNRDTYVPRPDVTDPADGSDRSPPLRDAPARDDDEAPHRTSGLAGRDRPRGA